MQAFTDGLGNLIGRYQPLVYIVVAVVLLVLGIMFIIPDDKVRDTAKRSLPWVIIGCGIALTATVLANEISGFWNVN